MIFNWLCARSPCRHCCIHNFAICEAKTFEILWRRLSNLQRQFICYKYYYTMTLCWYQWVMRINHQHEIWFNQSFRHIRMWLWCMLGSLLKLRFCISLSKDLKIEKSTGDNQRLLAEEDIRMWSSLAVGIWLICWGYSRI